jgi:hypothetical protein
MGSFEARRRSHTFKIRVPNIDTRVNAIDSDAFTGGGIIDVVINARRSARNTSKAPRGSVRLGDQF